MSCREEMEDVVRRQGDIAEAQAVRHDACCSHISTVYSCATVVHVAVYFPASATPPTCHAMIGLLDLSPPRICAN